MKKIILFLSSFMLCITIVNAEACSNYTLKQYNNELKKITYSLEYIDGTYNNADEQVNGYFNLKFDNLPDNYEVYLNTSDGFYSANDSGNFVLTGGVYKAEFYRTDTCSEQVIKTYEIMVPHYKVNCEYGKTCSDVWFDGTYEKMEEDLSPNKNNVSVVLIIVLVCLVLILIGLFVFIRKRKGGKL